MTKDSSHDSEAIIDEILAETDPDFVKGLESIQPSNLNGQEIAQVSDEQAAKLNKWYIGFWRSWETRVKVAFVMASFAGLSVVVLALSYMGWLVPTYRDENIFSWQEYADETLQLSKDDKFSNLYVLFPVVVYTMEIPERIYPFKAGSAVKHGRFAFYIEFFSKQDQDQYEQRKDQLSEALVNAIRKTGVEDWREVDGKEKIRENILSTINNSMKIRAKTVRFKSIFI
ncbi:MAG: hypothetical protein H6623_00545 [Bdellovibrionaceae bacterium]|nr:hypothetical protein [Pseudobdellovibrionaceae bacterium]